MIGTVSPAEGTTYSPAKPLVDAFLAMDEEAQIAFLSALSFEHAPWTLALFSAYRFRLPSRVQSWGDASMRIFASRAVRALAEQIPIPSVPPAE